MLEIRDLRFRYGKRAPLVLDGASLELKDGEIGILLGRNGSGKTTLFKTILGIEKPQSGQIRFDGKDLLRMSRRERARHIAYVPQDIQFGALSVYDTVLMGRPPRSRCPSCSAEPDGVCRRPSGSPEPHGWFPSTSGNPRGMHRGLSAACQPGRLPQAWT